MDDLETKIDELVSASLLTAPDRAVMRATLRAVAAIWGQPRADESTPHVGGCPKCGGGPIGTGYCNGEGWSHAHSHRPDGKPSNGEHLQRHCQRCHYEWPEPCSASEPRADVKPNASKPVLGEWHAFRPGHAQRSVISEVATWIAVDVRPGDYGFGWNVNDASALSLTRLASGRAPDLASAKRAADKAAREWYTLPEDAKPATPSPAPASDVEEAIGIVARAEGRTVEAIKTTISNYDDDSEARCVREIAAALARARSEVRIGTGKIEETRLTTDDGASWYGSRDAAGDVTLSWKGAESSAGIGITKSAFRALVALMARDGEGSR